MFKFAFIYDWARQMIFVYQTVQQDCTLCTKWTFDFWPNCGSCTVQITTVTNFPNKAWTLKICTSGKIIAVLSCAKSVQRHCKHVVILCNNSMRTSTLHRMIELGKFAHTGSTRPLSGRWCSRGALPAWTLPPPMWASALRHLLPASTSSHTFRLVQSLPRV